MMSLSNPTKNSDISYKTNTFSLIYTLSKLLIIGLFIELAGSWMLQRHKIALSDGIK